MRHIKNYIKIGVILTLALSPTATFAQYYYAQDNSYQIAQIQAQIDALRAQLASSGYNYNYGTNYAYPYNYNYGYTGNVLGASYLPSCNFTADLYLGMTHPQVAELNRHLGSGYSSYFDQATYNAVVNFQNQYAGEVLAPAGISYPTGVVGAFTRAKLNSLCNGIYVNNSSYGYSGYGGNVLGASTYNPYSYNNNYGTNYTYPYSYNYTGGMYYGGVPTLNLYVSNQNVNYNNDVVTLNWNSTGVSSCNASGGWTGTKNQNGTESRSNIGYATNFTLTCYGSGGTPVVRSVTATPLSGGTSGTPTINFYANPVNVYTGGSTTLYWTVTNANACSASGSWSGSKGTSGNESVGNITNTRTYTLTCTSSSNQSTAQGVTVGVL